MRKTIAIMAAALAAAGCSRRDADRAAVDASVVQLHQMIDAGRYHDIYAGAADEFRQSASEEDAIRFLQAMHDRLGAFRSTLAHWPAHRYLAGQIDGLPDLRYPVRAGSR